MLDVVHAIERFGYQSLFLALLLEALGLPVPGALALLAAGAATSAGAMHPLLVVAVAGAAMLTGDCVLYMLGRYSGWALLSFLCGVSLSPETCIFRTSRWFYERGRTTLLFAKFLPGVNSMAPPLAGSMNMRVGQFLRFDIGGAGLYLFAYGAIGYLFRDLFEFIAGRMRQFSLVAGWVIVAAGAVYFGLRAWQYIVQGRTPFIWRVSPKEVAERLSGQPSAIVIADVRSHGYYDPEEQRVRGSIRIEPNNLEAALDSLPKDTPIYLYCT
ncbi:MAG TPA: hypothetical protein VMB25_12985 [Bryobacteraceae bacterium]|nr:hypothetical protein [Bryobacteraceae bacterium]